MTALTILKYLFGHGGSIRLIAAHPFAVPVGLLLVGMAGVARNYFSSIEFTDFAPLAKGSRIESAPVPGQFVRVQTGECLRLRACRPRRGFLTVLRV